MIERAAARGVRVILGDPARHPDDLAARRRPRSVRLLMALPVATAVPLMVFMAIEGPLHALPDPFHSSPMLAFVVGSVAGIPVLAYAALIGKSVIRRRWGMLAANVGLTLLVSLAIGVAWLWTDVRIMAAVEHYGSSGWYLLVVPGAYFVGLLTAFDWTIRSVGRLSSGLGLQYRRLSVVASGSTR